MTRGLTASLTCIAMAGVCYQVALVRALSIVLWYHFAFLVVSSAVLGFGLSGMVMVLRPSLTKAEGLPSRLRAVATALSAAVLVGYAVLAFVPFDPFSIGLDSTQFVWGLVYILAMMFPFFLNGLFIGIILVHHADQAGRLYAFDLVGAGISAVATLLLFSVVGGEATLLLAAVLAAGAAVCISPSKTSAMTMTGAILLSVVFAAFVPLRVTEDKVIGAVPIANLLSDPDRTLETRWNSLARIDVVAFSDRQRDILIDAGVALTRLPHVAKPIDEYPPSTDFLALSFAQVDAPKVLILGSGGGWEVALALTHDAPKVTAVELNPAIVDLVQTTQSDWVGGIFADPRVELVADEARAFLSQSDDHWDVIISAHTISNAATASGSMNLAESHTLTLEAFDTYLDRISDRGVLHITRPEAQLPKLVATAAEALRRQDLEPKNRIVAFRFGRSPGSSFAAGILVAKDPSVLEGVVSKMPAHSASPLWAVTEGVMEPRYITAVTHPEKFNLATDDRPFFNITMQWSEITLDDVKDVLGAGEGGRLALEGKPVSEVSLLILLVLVFFVSVTAIGVPLWIRRDSLPEGLARGAKVALFFSALGVGYMYAELGLVHRLGVFLGSPTLTFGVVVAGMLLSSGVGAAVSQRLDLRSAPIAVGAAALVLAAVALTSGPMIQLALSFGEWMRLLAACLVVVPVGFALGFAFPLGMRRLDTVDGGYLPIAWGFNGFASVIGSATSIILASALGFSWLLFVAAAIYVVAALLIAELGRS